MRSRSRLALVSALLVSLTLADPTTATAQATPDVPSGDGAIRGVVVDDDSGAPMADVDVALYALSAEGLPGLRRGRSDSAGRFAFENVSRAPNLAYLVGARHRDVPYPGARITFGPDQTVHEVEIRISGLSDSTEQLTIDSAELRLERSAGGLRAVQSFRVANRGERTFYVEAESRAGREPALRARLPEGADDFQMPLGVVPEGVARDGNEVVWWGPVHPGEQNLSFSYALESADPDRVETTWELPDGAGSLRLWLPSGATLDPVPGLREADLPPSAGAPGFKAYEAEAVAPGHRLALALALPKARVRPDAASVTEVRALLTVDDAALGISETHTLEVTGDERVLGTSAAPLYRIALPDGLAQLRFGSSGDGVVLQPNDAGGLLVLGETEPGELRVELAYRLATRGFPARFERSFPTRVPLLSYFVADTGQLAPRSDRLHRRRPVRTADLTYIHLEAFEVASNETVVLELDRQPLRTRAPAWLLRGSLALGGVVLLALLVGPLWRGGREAWTPESTESAAERERQGVLAALRDLDHDYETGKVEAEDYETLRRDLRAQAIALMARERDGDAGADETAHAGAEVTAPAAHAGADETAPAAHLGADETAPAAHLGADETAPAEQVAGAASSQEGPFCTACGTRARPEHRFCANCGTALEGADGGAA